MSVQEPDLLAEVDGRCAHGVYEPDYCERCEEPGQEQPCLDFDTLVRAVIGSRYQWVRLEDAVDMATVTARVLVDNDAATVTVDGDALDVHRSVGAMRRLVDARGLLDDEGGHDPARPRAYPMLSGGHPAVVDALWLIDRHGCTSYTRGRCLDPHSGKKRGARYGADAWCDACIARDALNRLAEESS